LQKSTDFTHSRKGALASGREKVVSMTGSAMAASAETENVHPSSPSGCHPVHAIFDYQAITRTDAKLLGRKEKKIGSRLTSLDHGGTQHVRVEKLQKTSDLKAVTEPVGMTV
jgi:hypothetical protein